MTIFQFYFPSESVLAGSPLVFPSLVLEQNFWGCVAKVFLCAGCPSCHAADVKVLEETKSTGPKHGPGSSSTF